AEQNYHANSNRLIVPDQAACGAIEIRFSNFVLRSEKFANRARKRCSQPGGKMFAPAIPTPGHHGRGTQPARWDLHRVPLLAVRRPDAATVQRVGGACVERCAVTPMTHRTASARLAVACCLASAMR